MVEEIDVPEVNSLTSIEEIQQIANENAQQTKIFGEQIKAKTLKTDIGGYEYRIGHRKELLDLLAGEYPGAEYKFLEGVKLLARFKNILTSLGAMNVAWSAGQNKYWMSDFIRTFRQATYYLAFEFDNEHKATSQVILAQIMMKKQNILRKKYRFTK